MDGVGVYAREPCMIAEMFRQLPGGGIHSATAEETRPQLHMYGGYRVPVFDGPHHLPDALVKHLRLP